ncbi:MAG: glycosyltransferase [Sphingobacteriales bacterium]|nr:MAG: glycosyltransferase [Sphingobacteriales bacterium]
MKKLAIITTHPIQYYAPVFKLLAKKLDIMVFYTWGVKVLDNKYDPGFKQKINWDIPLLEGYNYHFTKNISQQPGSHRKKGIINPELITEITEFNADAILVYGYAYVSHLKVMLYFKGKIPVYFRGDSTLLDNENLLKKIAKKIYLTWVYKHIDIAFYVGNANRTYFKNYGVPDTKLVKAPHAIDNQFFSADKSDEAKQIRLKMGIQPNDILILFAGKFEPKKNPDLLIDTFGKIRKENIFLLMLGNGQLEQALKQKVKTMKKRKYIFFESFKNQSQLPAYYQACDLFCLPSKGPGETWGLAVNEAMAASKAILVSDKVGCQANLVIDGANGLIFNSKDAKDMYRKVKTLTFDKTKLIAMGVSSKKIIENYTFEIQANKIIETINEQ